MEGAGANDVELLRSMFAGWAEGDFTRGVTLYADDVYFTTAEPEGRHDGHGPAGVRRWMQQFLGAWEHYSVRVDEIEELGGGRYHGAGEQYARGRQSATETRMPAHVGVRMEDGKITRLVFSFSRDEAVARLDE